MFWKRSRDPKAELKARIGHYELPSFPAAAVSTLSLLRADTELCEIADRLMTDPGLSVQILRTVNSAAFGLRQPADTVAFAVSLLGRSRVEALVLSAAVADALPNDGPLDLHDFWRTSAQRACLAREVSCIVDPSCCMEAFTAGLLQDMASPVLAAAFTDRYVPLYRTANADPEVTLWELEREEFGFDHAEIGAMMAESWDLPEVLITGIADHHQDGQRAPRAVTAVARVQHSESGDDLADFREHCETALGVGEEALARMIETADAEACSLGASMTGRVH